MNKLLTLLKKLRKIQMAKLILPGMPGGPIKPKPIKSLDQIAWELVKPLIQENITKREQEIVELEITIESTKDIKQKAALLKRHDEWVAGVQKWYEDNIILDFLLDFFDLHPEYAYYVMPKSFLDAPEFEGINTDDVVTFMNKYEEPFNLFKHRLFMNKISQ